MFYTYNQNNSGGSFDFNPGRGISHYVVVEADTAKEADERAEMIGLYFDGDGDCSCCGDRWSAADSYWGADKGDEEPKIYDEPVATFGVGNKWKWMDGAEIFVHYADGRVEGFWETKETA
jgi:hypothetical protein